MQTVTLGNAGRSTTRLGFGGSSIMGVLNRRQSLAMLESAYDAGIRHFDTAPMYGYGEAERCLGEFLSRHRGEVTVTTKFGIPPSGNKAIVRVGRAVVGPLVQRFPGFKPWLRRATGSVKPAAPNGEPPVPQGPNPIFTAAQARASLERSLVALRTDHIDLWLLHEITAIDLAAHGANDELLRVLEDAVRDGKVGAFGPGSHRDLIPDLLSAHGRYCPVAQFEWSVLDPAIPATPFLRIHHRALSQNFHGLVDWLRAQPEQCRRWSDEVGADLGDTDVLARLMLKAALVMNPSSVILFSSKNPAHIRANIATAGDATLEAPARRLHALFQRERPPIAQG